MSFTDAELVDVRRFCGYPTHSVYGTIQAVDYGVLETKLAGVSDTEIAVVRNIYLTGDNSLYALESAVTASSANLDTDQASVWKHNRDEVAHRQGLFNLARRNLCWFIGVRPGPGLTSGTAIVRT